jgi:outer membrane protein assembly factor BamB
MKTSLRIIGFCWLLFLETVMGQIQPGTVLWSYDLGSIIVSSPALGSNNTVYVGSSSAFYAVTNAGPVVSNKWTFGAGLSLDNSSPAVGADGTIYFIGGSSNALFAVNPDGTQKWAVFKGGSGGTPAIGFDNTIYFQDYTGFYAITPSGDVRWKLLIGDGQPSSPVIGPDGTIYICSWEFPKICAIFPGGLQKWCRDLSNSPGDSPAISPNGILYVPGQPLCALAPDGTNIWSLDLGMRLDGPPVVGKSGTIYVAAS